MASKPRPVDSGQPQATRATSPGAAAADAPPDVPAELRYIWDAIARSRDLLNWADDWDEDGSPGYARATWDRATNFITRNAATFYERFHVRVDAPSILPGPDGSIDIQWNSGDRRLLINVPVDAEDPVSFYGDDRGRNAIEGKLDAVPANPWLLMWLVQ